MDDGRETERKPRSGAVADVAFLVGLTSVTAGVALIHFPAALIVAGLILTVCAIRAQG